MRSGIGMRKMGINPANIRRRWGARRRSMNFIIECMELMWNTKISGSNSRAKCSSRQNGQRYLSGVALGMLC